MSRSRLTHQKISRLAHYLVLIFISLVIAACNSQKLADLRNSPGVVRILLITQNNRLFEYEVKGLRGTARGYPQPFAQWHAVVLDENRQPLAMYSIWDPRLVLEHGASGAVWQPLDSTTSSLFDVVVPFSYDEDDIVSTTVLPRIVQIYDEAKTLLFEVDLTDALNEYCAAGGEGVGTRACEGRQVAFPLPPMPALPTELRLPTYKTPADERPQATIDPVVIFGNPAPIAQCIPLYEEQPDNVDVARDSLLLRASRCNVLNRPFSTLACASVEFEPGVGLFAPDADVTGLSWKFGSFALAINGLGSYTGNGVLLGPDTSLNLALGGCIATSVEMKLRPPDTQTNGTAVLKNAGITKSMPLPLQTRSRLRVGALPLAQDTSLTARGSNVVIERIRINLAPETEATITPTVTLTPTEVLTATATPTFTATPTDTPSPTPIPPSPTPVTPSPTPVLPNAVTGTPSAALCTVVSSSLNLRSGPGIANRPVRSLSRGTELIPLARSSDNSWLQVTVKASGEQGWVSAGAQYVRCGGEPPLVTITPPTKAASTPVVGITVTPAPPGSPCLIYDFEAGRGWVRGDETWGTFSIASEQVYAGNGAGKFDYNIPAGVPNNYFVYRRTDAGLPIACLPVVLCMQVYGDGSGNFLNTWVDDAQGTRWQFTFGRVTHTGWQEMAARLDPNQGWPNGPINNANATAVVQPLRLYAFIVDGTEDRAYKGVIYVDNLYAANACTTAPPNPPLVTPAPPIVTVSPIVTLPPDQPTPAPPPSEPQIKFSVDKNSLKYGECTTLHWSVQNVKAVYLEDEGVVGEGEKKVCPDETTDYKLHVITPTDAGTDREVTVTVEGGSDLTGTWDISSSTDPEDHLTELVISNDSGLVVTGYGECSASSCVNFGTERLSADGGSFVAKFEDVQTYDSLPWVELKITLDGSSLRAEIFYAISSSSCFPDEQMVSTDGNTTQCRYTEYFYR